MDRSLPYEFLFGHPPRLVKGLQGDLKEISNLTLQQKIQSLGLTLSSMNDWMRETPVSLTTPMHPYKLGNSVWVKEWNVQLLKPNWRSPFVIVLSTSTTVKVTKIIPRIYHS
jgi:hypothetical protein